MFRSVQCILCTIFFFHSLTRHDLYIYKIINLLTKILEKGFFFSLSLLVINIWLTKKDDYNRWYLYPQRSFRAQPENYSKVGFSPFSPSSGQHCFSDVQWHHWSYGRASLPGSSPQLNGLPSQGTQPPTPLAQSSFSLFTTFQQSLHSLPQVPQPQPWNIMR